MMVKICHLLAMQNMHERPPCDLASCHVEHKDQGQLDNQLTVVPDTTLKAKTDPVKKG